MMMSGSTTGLLDFGGCGAGFGEGFGVSGAFA